MDLRQAVESIVLQMEGFTFYYGRRSEANYGLDSLSLPAVVLIEPDSGGFTRNATLGRIKSTDDLFVQFIDQIEEAEHAEYRHPIVMSMNAAAAEFIQILDGSDLFGELPTYMPKYLIVDRYDVNVAGYELNIPRLTNFFPEPC